MYTDYTENRVLDYILFLSNKNTRNNVGGFDEVRSKSLPLLLFSPLFFRAENLIFYEMMSYACVLNLAIFLRTM